MTNAAGGTTSLTMESDGAASLTMESDGDTTLTMDSDGDTTLTRPTLQPVKLGGRIIDDPLNDQEFEKEFMPEIVKAAKEKFAKFYDLH